MYSHVIFDILSAILPTIPFDTVFVIDFDTPSSPLSGILSDILDIWFGCFAGIIFCMLSNLGALLAGPRDLASLP